MRKTKLLTVQFTDGEQSLPSSLKVECTVTGHSKSFHTPYLVRLIKRKYNNNWHKFISSYVSKEGRGLQAKTDDDEEPTLDVYKNYLITKYKYLLSCKNSIIIKHKLNDVKEVFLNRFPNENINELI